MPHLACWSCGRQIYTVSPIESLFAEERRCPRCGASLSIERRETDRRSSYRRVNPPNDPGPPKPKRKKTKAEPPPDTERREADRRTYRRRGGGTPPPPTTGDSSGTSD